VGQPDPGDRPGLAQQLGVHHPVPRLRAGSASRDLHHKRDRSLEPPAPQSDQEPKAVSPAKTPPASLSTSRSRTPSRNGRGPAAGRKPYSHSRSTSETDCPTDPSTPPTHKVGRPPHWVANSSAAVRNAE
jgi:hypothetical protein